MKFNFTIIKCIYLFISLSYTHANSIYQTKLYKINDINYISALEYADIQDIQTIFYKEKEKLELRFQNYKLLISPHSSFIKINEKIYHMYLPVIYDGNDFFIPANPFLNIINNVGMPTALLDSSEKYIITESPSYNIKDISIINKVNGSVIIIKTNKKFLKNSIAASITRGGWLNVTVAGGIVDSIKLVESPIKKPIIRIRSIQSKESSQISFLLKSKIDEFEIETHENNISIFLRVAISENANKIKEIRNKWLLDVIVIDAGHGGKDAGAIGINGLQEKTVNLDIARKLGKLIESNLGIKVVYTRQEDTFIPLWKRTKIANDSRGKVFISIHANATKNNHNVRGFETYLLRPGKTKDAIDVAQRENSVIDMEKHNHNKYKKLSNDKLIIYTMAQSEFMKESEFLAFEIQQELDKVLTSPNRGVKQAGFHVLVGASMPNILIETGFLSNKNDAKLLGQSRYRSKIAQAIFSALVNFKNKYENPIVPQN